jgi:hypothetical protein
MINSNTFAEQFISCIYKKTEEGQEILPDFSSILNKQNFKELDGYGKQVAPLEKIGGFLNDVGEVLIKDKHFFYPGHKVLTISLLENGDILTRAEHNCKATIFVSKRIVLSNGAR